MLARVPSSPATVLVYAHVNTMLTGVEVLPDGSFSFLVELDDGMSRAAVDFGPTWLRSYVPTGLVAAHFTSWMQSPAGQSSLERAGQALAGLGPRFFVLKNRTSPHPSGAQPPIVASTQVTDRSAVRRWLEEASSA